MKNTENTVKVWDPIVRIGHWILVIAFFIAYFTEDEFLLQHVWAGYVVGAVICIRILWGIVGTKHARFSDFVRSPTTILKYIRESVSGRPKRYIGHNPAGGLMILALMASILVTTYSGLLLYAIEDNAGPFAQWVSKNTAPTFVPALVTAAYGDENESDDEEDEHGREDGGREEFWEEIHEFFSNLCLLLVGLHVTGVLVSSYSHKENLVKAMINGRKRLDTSQHDRQI